MINKKDIEMCMGCMLVLGLLFLVSGVIAIFDETTGGSVVVSSISIGFVVIFLPILYYINRWKKIKQKEEEERRRKLEEERERLKAERERKKFEKEQRERGLVKFVGHDGKERWGTPKQVKRWKEIDMGLSDNFASYTPFEFEQLIGKLFEKMGYDTEVTKKAKDYGVDVIAKKGKTTVAIQAKKYKEGNNVGNKEIQQILGAMWQIKANKAILITTSDFTVYAEEQGKEAPVELWNKERLHEMVRKYFIDADV